MFLSAIAVFGLWDPFSCYYVPHATVIGVLCMSDCRLYFIRLQRKLGKLLGKVTQALFRSGFKEAKFGMENCFNKEMVWPCQGATLMPIGAGSMT